MHKNNNSKVEKPDFKYTPEQFKLYLDAARRSAETKNNLTEWDYYVFFALAYYTGMRKGEIRALRWADIDGDNINVRRSVIRKAIEAPPKNDTSFRSIQMPLPLIKVLEEHIKRYQASGAFSFDQLVCGGNRYLSDISIEKHNKRFAEEAGLPHIRIHAFRISHASQLLHKKIDVCEVARQMGWETHL